MQYKKPKLLSLDAYIIKTYGAQRLKQFKFSFLFGVKLNLNAVNYVFGGYKDL